MMLKVTITVAILLASLLLLAPPAFALFSEHFGNNPVPEGWKTITPDLRPLLNDPRRVYWYEVNGDANFYFRGDTPAANDVLRRFAAGGKGREVILHPGPLQGASFNKTRRFTADWEIHVPGGLSMSQNADGGLVTDKGPALHLYVGRARPAVPAPAAEVTRWIKELGSEQFKVRDRAVRDLRGQGQAAEVPLRRALAGAPPLEVRRRIEGLLAKLPGINLDLLAIPTGVTVVGPQELLARNRQGLRSQDSAVRGVAAYLVARREPDPKAAAAELVRLLKEDRDIRQSVAGALAELGKPAAAALPLLREGAGDPDVNVRNSFRAAAVAISGAKEKPEQAERQRRERATREDIERFLKSLREGNPH